MDVSIEGRGRRRGKERGKRRGDLRRLAIKEELK